MKLRDFSSEAPREWFQQLLEWSRKKITLADNVDCVFVSAKVETSETVVGHQLGRIPKYVMEVATWPEEKVGGVNSVTVSGGIALTKAPTSEKLFIKRGTSGQTTLLLM